jgi:hypothetical protein
VAARPWLALVLGLMLGLLLGACGGSGSGGPTAGPSASVSAAPSASLPASPVDGVIIAVDASSISDVRGFTLLTPDGQRIAFTLGTLENPTDFPPGHLMEHQATSEPVRVYFRVENGVPVVYRLGDAAAAGSPAAS